MSGKVDAIQLLRSFTIDKKPIKNKNNYLYFGSIKLKLQTPIPWKSQRTDKVYNLGSLWLFLITQYQKVQSDEYFKRAMQFNLEPVNYVDQDQIRKYFHGIIDTTQDISIDLKNQLCKDQSEDKIKQERLPDTDLEPHLQESLRVMQWITKMQKPLYSKTKIMRTPQRSYQKLQKLFQQMQRKRAQNQNQRRKGNEYPIIIVPQQQIQGNVCIPNIKKFLQNGQYIQPSQVKNKNRQSKEYINYNNSIYQVINNPITLTKDQWNRVCAIFVSGNKSQFSGWPLTNIGNLFARYKGFYVKWNQSPLNQAKQWNVIPFNIHKVKRYQDKNLKKQFWQQMQLIHKQ